MEACDARVRLSSHASTRLLRRISAIVRARVAICADSDEANAESLSLDDVKFALGRFGRGMVDHPGTPGRAGTPSPRNFIYTTTLHPASIVEPSALSLVSCSMHHTDPTSGKALRPLAISGPLNLSAITTP
jgi:hypothetical protein